MVGAQRAPSGSRGHGCRRQATTGRGRALPAQSRDRCRQSSRGPRRTPVQTALQRLCPRALGAYHGIAGFDRLSQRLLGTPFRDGRAGVCKATQATRTSTSSARAASLAECGNPRTRQTVMPTQTNELTLPCVVQQALRRKSTPTFDESDPSLGDIWQRVWPLPVFKLAGFGRNPTTLDPFRANLCEFHRFRVRQSSVQIRPDLAHFDRSVLNKTRPSSTNFGLRQINFGHDSSDVGRALADFGQIWVGIRRIRPNLARVRPHVVRISPMLG